jgi:hypothetical protein
MSLTRPTGLRGFMAFLVYTFSDLQMEILLPDPAQE